MREEVSKRKERSDKKRDVKPTIPVKLFECISNLSYIGNLPMKDVVEFVCKHGIKSKNVMEHLSTRFVRDVWIDNTLYRGFWTLEHKRYIVRNITTRRASVRFTKSDYDLVHNLSYALDYTISSTTGLLLEVAIKDIRIIDEFIKEYTHSIDNNRKSLLKEVIRYIKKDNPFQENISLYEVVKFVYDEVKEWVTN